MVEVDGELLLTIESPEGEKREATLAGSRLRIGTAPENEIRLADVTVSRHHATFERRADEFVILDAGSRNGVFVNGQRVGVHGHPLHPGDVITLGKSRLTVSSRAAAPPPPPPVKPPAPVKASVQAPVAAGAEDLGRVEIALPTGETLSASLTLAELSLGKGSENDLVLSDPSVSRRHAVIRRSQGEWRIWDAGSRNGVFVNGQRVGASGERIRPGDTVLLGQSRLSLIPGAAASAAAPGLAGKTLDGRYEIEAEVGRDASGTLYRARRVLLGDHVAVRLLRRDLTADPEALERFRRQAQVAARIHHPNSVQIYDFGHSADGTVYIVEELLPGRTLRDLVRAERGLTLPRVAGLFNQICGAVHAAHLSGIVLRDLKPESIFVYSGAEGKEVVKVGGSGLAKLDSAASGGVTMALAARAQGTPPYMSPEQLTGRRLDSRADVYALGVILYELLTGAVPFDARTAEEVAQLHLHAPVPDLAEAGRPDLDEGVAAVVNRALAKEPGRRQPTALHLAAEFEAASGARGGLLGALVNRATGLLPIAPLVVPQAPPPAPAGEATLPSVVAQAEEKGRGAFSPVVLALMAEAFFSRISGGLLKTAVPLYALLVFGLDITTIMALELIQGVVPLLLRPVFGNLADKHGKKRVFMISLVIRTAVGGLYAAATSLPALFAINAVRGIADSAKGPSVSAMIADHTDERHIARAYSWYTTTKSTSGGIGEAIAAFLLAGLLVLVAGRQTVTASVAVLDELNRRGAPVEVFLRGPDEVGPEGTIPGDAESAQPRRVARVEQREVRIRDVPLEDLPKVIDAGFIRRALVMIFVAATFLSALSLLLVWIFVREKQKDPAKAKKEKPVGDGEPGPQPNVWAFALLGTALTAPGYMVTGQFFTLLAVKLGVTAGALGWIKTVAETIVPLLFGPFFGWLADRIGTGRVIALRSLANIVSSLLFWVTPWFATSALLGAVMGLARGVDEIGKAAFKPTWGAIAAKISSFNLASRSRTMGILEAGVDASDLLFPQLAGVLLQYFSLGPLMAVRAALALAAEAYGHLLMRKHRI